ncbi:MAG: zf-HC2 domain-containing protein [Acidobacteriota bacterium]|nr:zf-HC2 domain-containing protein [Acidobacteriota bacterium]
MNHEATVELLSRFLDGEVTPGERQRVEEWLAESHEVREIYEGLGRVRGSLGRLAETAPPAHLGELVRRRVALEGEATGLWGRVEGRLRSWTAGPGLLTPFAVVLALAAMLYVLANGLARFERAREPVYVTAPDTRIVAGRQLSRHGGRWVEAGLDPARLDEAARIVVAAADAAEWARQRPELAPLVELGTVVVELDGEVVVLVFESAVASGRPANEP